MVQWLKMGVTAHRPPILSVASVIAMLPAVALAQATTRNLTQTPPPAAAQSSSNAGGGQSAANESTSLGEVVVTASRRAVNLQRESRSISVVDGQTLQRKGVTDVVQLQELVPGLAIARAGSELQVILNGVGDRTAIPNGNPAIAINIDGVYYPRLFETADFSFDLARVEVLKGPQGTLYGRNASGGAINYITTRPSFQDGGYLEAGYGNYDAYSLDGAVNRKLSDTVAVRLSGQWEDRDGYLTGGFNDDKHYGVRAEALLEPDPDTTVLLTGAYSHQGGRGDGAILTRGTVTNLNDFSPSSGLIPGTIPPPLPSNTLAGPNNPEVLTYLSHYNIRSTIPINLTAADTFKDVNTYLASADIEHNFGPVVLTVVPAFIYSTLEDNTLGGIRVNISDDARSQQESIEARLSSPAGARIKWVAGVFAADEDLRMLEQQLTGAALPSTLNDSIDYVPSTHDQTAAVFGEANASITDRFRLIAGARYTFERTTQDGYTGLVQVTGAGQAPLSVGSPLFPKTGPSVAGALTVEKPSFRVGAEYDVSPESMLYATIASGFKAGGFFAYQAPNNGYRPETLTSYTVGWKNRFLDNRLQLNVEGFYWDYANKQETFLTNFPPNPALTLATFNAGQVTIAGGDVSAAAQISDHDRLTADVGYLYSNYDKFSYQTPSAIDPTLNCRQTSAGGMTTVDCSGHELVDAAPWTGRIGYEHTQELWAGAGRLTFDASTRFSSSYFFLNNFTKIATQGSYKNVDLSLTWDSPSEKLAVTAYVTNLTNNIVATGGVSNAFLTDAAVAQIAPPRFYGLRARVKF